MLEDDAIDENVGTCFTANDDENSCHNLVSLLFRLFLMWLVVSNIIYFP